MNEPLPVREVRWMGMAAGVLILGIGGFLAVSGLVMGATLVLAAFRPPGPEPMPPVIPVMTGVNLLLGVLLFLYGRSVFRRARTDAEVVATVGMPGTASGKGLAWAGVVFSSLLLLGAAGGLISALAMGGRVPSGLFGVAWFVPVLVASIRRLRLK